MYWQKRFDRKNPDQVIEEKIVEIRKEHKDYGYRRILGELRNQGYSINKKKVQRMKKTIFEEMGGTYIRQGDYLIPCLTLPEEENLIFL